MSKEVDVVAAPGELTAADSLNIKVGRDLGAVVQIGTQRVQRNTYKGKGTHTFAHRQK